MCSTMMMSGSSTAAAAATLLHTAVQGPTGYLVVGIFALDGSDWSNGLRYHHFDTKPDTEFNNDFYNNQRQRSSSCDNDSLFSARASNRLCVTVAPAQRHRHHPLASGNPAHAPYHARP